MLVRFFIVLVLMCLPVMAFAQDSGAAVSAVPWWITLIIALLAAAIAVLREVAPKTPNKYDDKALALLSLLKPEQITHLSRMLDPKSKTTQGPTLDNPDGS